MGQDLLPFISSEDRVRDLTPAERLEGLVIACSETDERLASLMQVYLIVYTPNSQGM
jgi:hypothetical protein